MWEKQGAARALVNTPLNIKPIGFVPRSIEWMLFMLASEIFRLLFGFVAVLGMIGLCALAAKKAGLASIAGASGGRRRLAMREVLPIDARRRLAIVKCDDTEYLIMLGPTGETLIDKNLDGAVTGAAVDDAALASAENPFTVLGGFAEKFRAVKKAAFAQDQTSKAA